jgi:hypothetical protein
MSRPVSSDMRGVSRLGDLYISLRPCSAITPWIVFSRLAISPLIAAMGVPWSYRRRGASRARADQQRSFRLQRGAPQRQLVLARAECLHELYPPLLACHCSASVMKVWGRAVCQRMVAQALAPLEDRAARRTRSRYRRSVAGTTMSTLRLPHQEQTSRSRHSGTVFSTFSRLPRSFASYFPRQTVPDPKAGIGQSRRWTVRNLSFSCPAGPADPSHIA